MLTFLATFAVFVLVISGMSLGWIIKRKSIQGSCGGISSIGMEKCAIVRNRAMRGKADGSRAATHYLVFWSGKATPPPDNSHAHFSTLICLLYTYPVTSEGLLCAK